MRRKDISLRRGAGSGRYRVEECCAPRDHGDNGRCTEMIRVYLYAFLLALLGDLQCKYNVPGVLSERHKLAQWAKACRSWVWKL